MKKTNNFFFAGLAIAALAAGGFTYSNAADSKSQLSAVQLETIEALSHDEENGFLYVVPIEYSWGWGCNCAGKGKNECHL